MVDSYVQEWVAGSNGRMYRSLINRLREYPIPRLPLPDANGEVLLDIGCSWGRWMVSAARKGYVPIGIDIKIDALQAARRVLSEMGLTGYVVNADLKSLPFQANAFDKVFSYSVLQHTHRDRTASCLQEVHRILKPAGQALIEFPMKYGIGNYLRGISKDTREQQDYDSWCVRYYTTKQLRDMVASIFPDSNFVTDCYFGIGLQWSDIGILPAQYKPVVAASELLRRCSSLLPVLQHLADSLYLRVYKTGHMENDWITAKISGGNSNLSILPLLACPVSRGPLVLSPDGNQLFSHDAGLAYDIIDGIPILVAEAAHQIKKKPGILSDSK